MKIPLIRTLIFILFISSFAPIQATVISFTKDADGATFILDKGLLKVKVCKADIVEVKYTSLSAFAPKTSLVVVNEWLSIPAFSIAEVGGEVVMATSKLKIKVNRATNAIQYTDLNNTLILSEDGAAGKSMRAATIAGISTNICETQFISPADEALFGLGCHPEDTLSINYKGRNQDLAIKYLTGAIPVLISNKGYGLMWDNYSASNFYGSIAGNTKYKYESESGLMVDYYFFYGPDPDHVIASYREASGPAPMFPKWAFGLFQSQDRYQSQAEVLSVKDKYRNNKIPVDCIVQDWFYWEPNVIGSHVMYPTRFPNPKEMVDELHKANIHAMISIWPVFAQGTNNFDEMKSSGGLTDILWKNAFTFTYDSYYDTHSPKARALYWKQSYEALIKPHGWDAWWVDQCEPDSDNMDDRKRSNFAIGKGIDYFNTYSLMHTVGLYNNWRRDIPNKRPFFLARQAFAGQQRNATTLWSSDITCTFKAYKSQVPQGINACASGMPYWTSDIGGYHLNWMPPNWASPEKRELFTRWFQFGAFSPIFRIHGKGERAIFSSNWDENTRSILLKYDNLRYRLMPYLYSLGWKVTNEGYTIMRALVFDFKTDAGINNIPDQYMFGPAFLVNPVMDRMYSLESNVPAEKTRKVYLPKTTKWYDFWTGKTLEGGQTITAAAPIETIPLYIKAGSIVPMGPFLQYATEKPADPIELRIYAGADGQFVIYEDENENNNYEKGQYATFEIQWNDKEKTVTVLDRKGSFPQMVNSRKFNVVLVKEGVGTGVELSKTIDKTFEYSGKKVQVKL